MRYYPDGFSPLSEDVHPGLYPVDNRVRTVAGYGYPFAGNERQRLSQLYNLYNNNGGIPDLLFDAGLSVNYNLFTATATLSTQTVTLPVGTFTFGFVSGAGSITSSNGTGTATGHGTATVGVNRTITVTVTGTFTFTVSGAVNQAQLNVGSTLLSYRARTDATAPLSLNLGTAGTTGDGTFVNGSNANMLFSDPVSGLAYNFVSANNQYIDTNLPLPTTGPVTYIFWFNSNSVTVNQYPFSGRNSTASFSTRISGSKLQVLSTATSVIDSTTSNLANNTWYMGAITLDASKNWQLALNGIVEKSGTTVLNFTAGDFLRIGARNSALEPINGEIGHIARIPASLTPAQLLNIFNSQKSQYGY